MNCFGLHGGLGNAIFCLPAIKALARRGPVDLYVRGDYPMGRLFGRCRYARRVVIHPEPRPPARAYLCGQYPPTDRPPWVRCGFPDGTRSYTASEWHTIKANAMRRAGVGDDRRREDVTDWLELAPRRRQVHVGIVCGCKPGSEWERKKYPRMFEVVLELVRAGRAVEVFGVREEVEEAGLEQFWTGPLALEELPERLAACRVIIGTDSGVAHLASSLGVPTVMLFTATSPVKGDPVGPHERVRKLALGLPCSPCQSTPRWRECNHWRCRDIEVEQVLSAADDLLRGRLPVIR